MKANQQISEADVSNILGEAEAAIAAVKTMGVEDLKALEKEIDLSINLLDQLKNKAIDMRNAIHNRLNDLEATNER